MNKHDFMKQWDEDVLENVNVIIGRKTNIPYSINCYEENSTWKIAEVGERQDVSIIMEGSEDDVFDKLNRIIRAEMKLKERRTTM